MILQARILDTDDTFSNFDLSLYSDFDELCSEIKAVLGPTDEDTDPDDLEVEFGNVISEEYEGEKDAFGDDPERYYTSGYADLDDDGKEMVMAYYDNVGGIFDSDLIEQAQEAFQGTYKNDAEFAEQLAEDLGYIDRKLSWPHNCIDWEQAGRECMHDYFESNGYYFRNT